MNEGVTVNAAGGAPTLTLNDGGEATYDAGGSNPSAGALVFDYLVGAQDATPDLSIFSVNLPTVTTVRDAGGYNADFSPRLIGQDLGLQINPAFVDGFYASPTGSALRRADRATGGADEPGGDRRHRQRRAEPDPE